MSKEEAVVVRKKKQGLLKRLYDWTLDWSKTPKAVWALLTLSFAESSFFPIPPDVLLIAMTVSKPEKWWFYTLVTTFGSLTGALFGYLIGYGLYETVGQPIVDFYDLNEAVANIGLKYNENAFLAVFGAAFTPIPFKVITISAGLFKINIFAMFVASAIGRFSRFFLVAGLLRIFGQKVADFIERYFNVLSIALFVLLIAGFYAVKYLF